MSKYKFVDAVLLREIAACRNATYHLVDASNVETREFWTHYQKDGMRVVDRRLQALKKSRKISYDRKTGWVIAQKKVTM